MVYLGDKRTHNYILNKGNDMLSSLAVIIDKRKEGKVTLKIERKFRWFKSLTYIEKRSVKKAKLVQIYVNITQGIQVLSVTWHYDNCIIFIYL